MSVQALGFPQKLLAKNTYVLKHPTSWSQMDVRDRSLFMARGGDRVLITFYDNFFRGPLNAR